MQRFLPVFCLLWLYQFSRLWNLVLLPVFMDESIYLWRAQQYPTNPGLRYSLREGRLLQELALSLVQGQIPGGTDANLFVGRWLTTACNGLIVALLIALGRPLGSQRAGFVAAACYIVSPFSLHYDRLIAPDSLMALWYVLCLWLSLRMADRGGWRHAFGLGAVLALALLTKISGALLTVMPLLAETAVPRRVVPRTRALQVLLIYLMGAVVAALMLLFVALGGVYGNQAATTFQPVEILARSATNGLALVEWLAAYLPGALLWVAGLCLALGVWRLKRFALPLLGSVLLATGFYLAVSREWYPRYVVPLLPMVWLLAANGVEQAAEWIRRLRPHMRLGVAWAALLAGAVLGPSLAFDFRVLFDPVNAPWPAIERWQYVEGYPAGYQLEATADFLVVQAAQSAGGISVARAGVPGHTVEGLNRFLARSPRVHLHLLDADDMAAQLAALAQERPTYVVVDLGRPDDLDVSRFPALGSPVRTFAKPGGQSAFAVFQR